MKGTLTRRGTRQDVPPPPGQVVHLKKIKANDHLVCVILSATWEGFNTHYYDDRTHLHIDEKKMCEGCKLRRKLLWYGFLHVCSADLQQNFLISINNNGAHRLDKLQGDRKSLRGLRIETYRENNYAKGSLVIEPLGWLDSTEKLPMAKSAIPTLERLWNCCLTD